MSMRDKAPRCALALVAALAFGGCAMVAPNGNGVLGTSRAIAEAPEGEQSAETVISALASFGDTLTMLSPESQRQELEEAERALQRGDGSLERLRLALLLTLVDEDLRDLERARVLIAESVVVPEHPAHVGLARLMAMLIAELQATQVAAQQAVEQAVEQAAEQQHDDGMLALERAECEALQERLARLKDIEKQLNERAQPSTLTIDDDDESTQNPPGR